MLTFKRSRRPLLALAATVGFCLLAYSRALTLPLISDDYLQIQLGRDYGPMANWHNLAADALYRCRATSIVITYWTERIFGVSPLAFNVSSLLIHVLNTWLVLALGFWRVIGWRVSSVAACFFAIYQGHQEAVIWYAALPELLVFLFALGSFLFWIAWMQASRGLRGREIYYAGAMLCYILALLSKESGVVVAPLMLLAAWMECRPWKEALLRIGPFGALAVLYFAMIYLARSNHLHFHDGTFSIDGPFWIVVPVSVGRLLWVWGLFSLMALACWRERRWMRILWTAAVWMVITLLPYSFLVYMRRVPSRHTYLASAGLALIVAAGILTFRERFHTRPWAVGVLASILVTHECLYIWIKKQAQFQARAAPTERLLQSTSDHQGPLHVECFPYDSSLAKLVVKMYYGDRVSLIFDAKEAETSKLKKVNLCTAPEPPTVASTKR